MAAACSGLGQEGGGWQCGGAGWGLLAWGRRGPTPPTLPKLATLPRSPLVTASDSISPACCGSQGTAGGMSPAGGTWPHSGGTHRVLWGCGLGLWQGVGGSYWAGGSAASLHSGIHPRVTTDPSQHPSPLPFHPWVAKHPRAGRRQVQDVAQGWGSSGMSPRWVAGARPGPAELRFASSSFTAPRLPSRGSEMQIPPGWGESFWFSLRPNLAPVGAWCLGAALIMKTGTRLALKKITPKFPPPVPGAAKFLLEKDISAAAAWGLGWRGVWGQEGLWGQRN